MRRRMPRLPRRSHTSNLLPKRLTGRYEYSHEIAASVGDVEQALRNAISPTPSCRGCQRDHHGAAVDPNEPRRPRTFRDLFRSSPHRPHLARRPPSRDYAGSHAASVDGIHAGRESEVSSDDRSRTFLHPRGIGLSTRIGRKSGSEALMRRSAGCMASVLHSGRRCRICARWQSSTTRAGRNGGRPDHASVTVSAAAVWPTLEIIPGEGSLLASVSQGESCLTWHDAMGCVKVAFRADCVLAGWRSQVA